MDTLTPVDKTKQVLNFQLYLRRKFYPNIVDILVENINSTIPAITNISYTDGTEFKIHIKQHRNRYVDYSVSIENILVTSFVQGSLIKMIMLDTELPTDTKDYYNAIYRDIISCCHESEYMKMIYDYKIVPVTTTNQVLIIGL